MKSSDVLERTIVARARQYLQELRVAADSADPDARDMMSGAYRDALTLTELSHIVGSGLSNEGVAELLKIESEINALIKAMPRTTLTDH